MPQLLRLMFGTLQVSAELGLPSVAMEFPAVVSPTSNRQRGDHALFRYATGEERCISCRLCEVACPANSIGIHSGECHDGTRRSQTYDIDLLRCIYCGFCVEACPTHAIRMPQALDVLPKDRDGMVLVKRQLLARGHGVPVDNSFVIRMLPVVPLIIITKPVIIEDPIDLTELAVSTVRGLHDEPVSPAGYAHLDPGSVNLTPHPYNGQVPKGQHGEVQLFPHSTLHTPAELREMDIAAGRRTPDLITYTLEPYLDVDADIFSRARDIRVAQVFDGIPVETACTRLVGDIRVLGFEVGPMPTITEGMQALLEELVEAVLSVM